MVDQRTHGGRKPAAGGENEMHDTALPPQRWQNPGQAQI
jgi:hypothetical protein